MSKEKGMVRMESISGKSPKPQCIYCRFGTASTDGESVFCIKRGVMLPFSKCRKYKYDPLKREPYKEPQVLEYKKEDFSL
jgi:hypothetical protein